MTNIVQDPKGRFLVLQIVIEGESLTLVNVYAPTQNEGIEQTSFLENINSVLDELEISDLFMGGDFNIHTPSISYPSSQDNTTGDNSNSPPSSQKLPTWPE